MVRAVETMTRRPGTRLIVSLAMGLPACGAGSPTGRDPHDAGASPPPIPCPAPVQTGTATNILLDGNAIASDNVNGLTFKSFGVLSANGTSELLMDYKSEHPEQYAELLRILFGGTSPVMTHVKIEMGNDRNNSTGSDPATMRLGSEAANVKRHPGFQLAADAKRINSSLRVSILRWSAPGWANGNELVYTWYKNTILEAYRSYGYMVDYVNPGVNENAADPNWTKLYADRVRTDATGFASATEQALYNAIKIVISDEAGIGSFGGVMVSDAALQNAVSVAGYHYNTDDDAAGNFKVLAEQLDKEVWNSEGQATFSNTAFRPFNNMRFPTVVGTGIGGPGGPLEMGNTIIKGFVNSRRTHFIYQPAIGSFYEGGQYAFKELLSARDPWSGWIHFDAAIHILRHFSWFARTGWENTGNTAGIWRVVPQASATGATGTNPVDGRNGTPSFLTLAAPDKKNFSTVFVNDSERAQTYTVAVANMASRMLALELWETRAADTGAAFNRNYLKYLCTLSPDADGLYTIDVKPYSAMTATTLARYGNAEYAAPLPVEGERTVLDTDSTGSGRDTSDGVLYADDFDYSEKTVPVFGERAAITGTEDFVTSRGGPESVIPRYFSDRNGAFEGYLPSGSDNYVLRQQLDQSLMRLGGTWNSGDPITGVGDRRWLNYKASVDVSFENDDLQSGNNYAALGVRQQGGASSHTLSGTPYALKFSFDGSWALLVDGSSVASGNLVSGSGGVTLPEFETSFDAWHTLTLEAVDAQVTASLDGAELATFSDPNPRLSGRVDLASGYFHTRFDNLRVETVDGYPPYYSELLDNLEMQDLAEIPQPKLVYGGSWAHQTGKTMYHYQRTQSTSLGSDATLEYSFTGTGLDVLGPNAGTALLEVTVDGEVANPSASTMAATEFYQTFTLRELVAGPHTVQLKVMSGVLAVDAVGVVP